MYYYKLLVKGNGGGTSGVKGTLGSVVTIGRVGRDGLRSEVNWLVTGISYSGSGRLDVVPVIVKGICSGTQEALMSMSGWLGYPLLLPPLDLLSVYGCRFLCVWSLW